MPIDPVIWDKACRVYGFVSAVDPVTLSPQQRHIIERAYEALSKNQPKEFDCPHCGKTISPPRPVDPEILEIPVEDLEFSVRVANVLYGEKIKTVGDLIQKSQASLLRLPNFGKISLQEIKHILSGLGLGLRRYDRPH